MADGGLCGPERKAKKRAIGAAPGFARAIVDAIRDPVVVLDPQMNVILAARSFREYFGVKPEGIEGRAIFDLADGRWDIPRLRRFLERILPGSATFEDFEVAHDLPGLGQRVLNLSARPINDHQCGPAILLAFEDITERKRVGEALDRATQARDRKLTKRIAHLAKTRMAAERASQIKSEFLARVIHELRTPLNAIIGFSDLMREERLGPIGTAAYKGYADDIHTSAEHLMDLINDLLDLSKIEAGKYRLRNDTIDVVDLIEAAVAMVRVQADAKGQRIVVDAPEPPPRLLADRRANLQMLLNILSNAIAFTPQGGSITVHADRQREGPNVGLRISVEDTGVGMAADELDRAMSPYEQLDAACRPDRRGTGLGLPIVKSLIELHGGSIEIRSAPGKGTAVALSYPTECVIEAAPPSKS